ncbi:hypothetical protein D3C81_1087290 [compost metagenome]
MSDEVHRVGILGRLFNVFTGCASQVAIGDVVGHGIAEQGHVLSHLGDMPTQVQQLVLFHLDAIDEDFALVVVIETRNQVGQGRLAAARTPHQRHHLPGLDRETDVIEHLTLGVRVGKAEVAHVQATADDITLDGAGIDFRLDIQLFEDTFSAGHTFLDGRADFGQLANRLGQQTGQGDVGHHVAGGRIAPQEQHQEHQHGHGGVDHQLQQRRVDGAGAGHAQLLVGVALAGIEETFLFVLFTAEAAHHAIALDRFGRHMRHVPHGQLDFLALLAEFLAGRAHHEGDQRQDGDHDQRQAPVHVQQRGKQEDHRHAFTDYDLDRICCRPRDHGHVEGDT